MPNDVIKQITVNGTTYDIDGGGHIIENSAGTDMTKRSNLQFTDAKVTDDSTNNRTKIENVQVIDDEDELEDAPDGMYMGSYDDADIVIDASNVGYDNTNSGLNADNIQDAIDELTQSSESAVTDVKVNGVSVVDQYGEADIILGTAASKDAGSANGVAELDSTGKVPSSQLPSYVDDVIEEADISHFPITGETGKIYVALDTNKTYRWGGSEYVEISESLALGETSSTAYAGNKGKANADAISALQTAVSNKVDKDGNKVLSDNNYDNTAKGIVDSVTTNLATKADKVTNATNGNLAGLNGTGNLTDSGWNGAKDTTSISGNPISISGLKANQLAKNPIITFEPIQDLHGQSKPYPAGGGKNKLNMSDRSLSAAGWLATAVNVNLPAGKYTFSCNLSGTGASGQFQLFNNGTEIARPSFSFVNGLTTTTFTCSQDVDTINLWSNATGSFSKFQIESGESYTSYAPYENICPISGYDKIEVLSCGKNIWDNSKNISGGYYDTTGWKIESSYATSDLIPVKPNAVYSGSLFSKAGQRINNVVYTLWSDENTCYQQVTSSPITTDSNTKYIRIRNFVADASYITGNNYQYQLEEGSTASTTFYPYHKTTDLSESLGQTVYWLTHTVRTGIAKILGQLLVNPQNLDWHEGSRNVFYAALTSGVGNGWSSHYAFSNLPYQTMDDLTWYTQNNYIYVRNTNYGGNIPGFAASLNDVQFVYPLATPTEIQLTPHEISLLKDYAYVSTNGTNIALDYHNGELASLADVSQLGETVNDGLNYLQRNNGQSGTAYVDISSYNSATNKYIFPNDGYVYFSSQGVSTGTVEIPLYGANDIQVGRIRKNISATYQDELIFVRKGMKCCVTNKPNNTFTHFYPLV